jgi:tRNA pseudouridine55 synthase
MNAPKKQRADVHGWIALDKPLGMTSTHAVAVVRRLLNAKKAGHAGTLDPLASGLLPLAFGEATKTVPYVVDGEKAYRFTVTFGIETDTDDSEGRIVSQSEARPTEQQILAALPKFTGAITQVPPRYSAIKIDGERAYDLARGGEAVELQPRIVEIHTLTLRSFDGQSAVLEAECGKGTYVRAIARDLGRMLGCFGYVTALRRTRVGPFTEADAVTLPSLEADVFAPAAALKSVDTGLRELVEVPVGGDAPMRLRRGQSIILRGRDAPPMPAK